MIFHYKS